MKRILIDCDGVLADFLGGVLEIINKEYFSNLSASSCLEWEIEKAFALPKGMVAEIAAREGFCLNLNRMPGAALAVSQLREQGHDVYCVTSPWLGPHWMPERTQWLSYFFGFDKKHIVCGDVMIDDKASTVAEWTDARPNSLGIVWDYPHNQSLANIPGRIERAKCWDDMHRMLERQTAC